MRPISPLADSIMNAIAGHAFLETLEITLEMTCLVFSEILSHLPPQLRELEIAGSVEHARHHKRCEDQSLLLSSQLTAFRLRRLILCGEMPCFIDRMIVQVLQRCPELEELMLPSFNQSPGDTDITGVAQVLDSSCGRLHKLNQDHSTLGSGIHLNVLLRTFSKGFRRLQLSAFNCFPTSSLIPWDGEHYLETVLTSVTVDTLEVLRCRGGGEEGDRIIGIVRHCARLRELRVLNEVTQHNGADLTDLVLSMDEPWKCWSTLEVLELMVDNRKCIHESLAVFPRIIRRQKTIQDTRQLCLQLRSLSKLVTLDIHWSLRMPWGSRESALEIGLDDLNKDAERHGLILMTREDMVWMGLS